MAAAEVYSPVGGRSPWEVEVIRPCGAGSSQGYSGGEPQGR